MRLVIAILAVFGLTITSAAAAPILASSSSASSAYALLTTADQQQPPSGVDVNIDVNKSPAGAWYTNPVWIAIGVLAFIAIVALVLAAGRGGTTVIKD